MKSSKSITAVFFVLYIICVVFLQKKYPNIVYVLAGVIGGLFLFSIVVRRSIFFKPYFTSKYNIFTSKIRHQKEFDLPKEILFDKMREVLTEADFKVQHADKKAGILFATSQISFFSWGENIYIDLKEENEVTKLDFCSACLFGVTSWGRNEKNYEHLFETFEKSLTI